MSEKIWVCDDEPSQRFPVYTRGNVGEVFVEAVSPLTWSAYGPNSWDAGWRDAFCEIGLFTPDEFGPPGKPTITGCFGGYVYINMSVTRVLAVRIPGMTVEAIDKSLFGDYPDVPPYRADPRDQNAERSAQALIWLQSLFSVDPKPVTSADRARLDEIAARRPDWAALSDQQLLEYFRSLLPDARHMFKRHVINSYGANVLSGVIVQICQAVGAPDLASKVTAAIGDVDSADQSFDLWELSRQVKSSPTVTRAFDQGVEGLLSRLGALSDPSAKRFVERWNAFIARWGFIGPSVWELRSTTYSLSPEIPLRMLDRARQAPDSAAPSVRTAELIAQREAAIAEVARRVAGNAEAHGQFMAAAPSAGNYLAARERSKMHCTLAIEEGRKAVRELGQRMVARGHIARWEHVLMVTNAEADAFLADPAAFKSVIPERAARLEVLKSKEPPFVFDGKVPPFATFKDRGSGKIDFAGPGTQLTGLGVSPGRYTGRARVITSLSADSELEPGEVIVAAITDASWGPLFLAAGAVVVETGATVSHAAIVSRELGIPAVVSVTDVTRRIRDGSRITVDGGAGTIVVH